MAERCDACGAGCDFRRHRCRKCWRLLYIFCCSASCQGGHRGQDRIPARPVAGSEEREHEMWVAIHAAYRHGYGRGASDEAANLFHITRATNEYMDNLPSRSALLLAALRGEREGW